jgi:UDP-GlcNAc:undecaprenyl-phosphate GlcNAc-1-phosphate transferase
MHQYQYLIFAYALGVSCGISAVLTHVVRRLALRWGILDHPGERKVHRDPVPLMGGVAIVGTFFIMIGIHLAVLVFKEEFGSAWIEKNFLAFLGADSTVKLTGVLTGGALIFLLGVVDDLKVLTPWLKLVGQIAAAAVLVLSGIRIELFVFSNVWLSALVTIFWVVMMTNSMNFLDNMDGLCGGVAVIAAFSFFLCVQPYDEQLVRFLLMIFAGSVAGFLYHNLNPARIFMGDAGAMFIGYFLATVAVLGTFHMEGTPSRVAVAAPLLALSVPLFDTFSVVYLRWRNGQSIMLGDKRHFSHRLVELGMSPRQAVAFIFLVAGVTGLGAAMLPVLDVNGTLIILAQTAGVYLLIVLLMNVQKNGSSVP